MSGGHLVVIDRGGRDVKRYNLERGVVTLGSHPACDIRVMLPTVDSHHATVAVHANQTVVRNISAGATLVNGRAVSVHALKHRDVISLGGRALRWEYERPERVRPARVAAELPVRSRQPKSRGRARLSEVATSSMDPALHTELEMKHRASTPGAGGSKQVAIVKPQRRDEVVTKTQARLVIKPKSVRVSANGSNRSLRKSNTEPNLNLTDGAKTARKTPKKSPNKRGSARISTSLPNVAKPRGRSSKSSPVTVLDTTETKASQWIASRKSSPRKSAETEKYVHVATPRPRKPYVGTPVKIAATPSPRAPASARASSLRTLVLRNALPPRSSASVTPKRPPRSASKRASKSVSKTPKTPRTPKVIKIQAPKTMDASKKAALMILTRTPKAKMLALKNSPAASTSATVQNTPAPTLTPARTSGARSRDTSVSSNRDSVVSNQSARKSRRDASASVFEITDSEMTSNSKATSSMWADVTSSSFQLQSPRKSALKDPNTTNRKSKKSESIKFDLSNLEGQNDSDVFLLTDDTDPRTDKSFTSEDDITLQYSDTEDSPRRRSHCSSRASRILEKSLGEPFVLTPGNPKPPSPSPSPRKSHRGSLMVRKALENSFTESPNASQNASSNKSKRNNDTISIVDLVSMESNDSQQSVYDSVGSSNSTLDFGTPSVTKSPLRGRRVAPVLVSSSTPVVKKTGRITVRRSHSTEEQPLPKRSRSAILKTHTPRGTTSRSKSLSTPLRMGKSITINATQQTADVSARTNDISELDITTSTERNKSLSENPSLLKKRRSGVSATSTPAGDSLVNKSKATSRNKSSVSRYSGANDTTKLLESTASPDLTRKSTKGGRVSNTTNTTTFRSTRRSNETTPEQTPNTSEPGTPVINMQNLLNLSDVSAAAPPANRRVSGRKTIAPAVLKAQKQKRMSGPRTEPRGKRGRQSKALNLSNVRKVLLRRKSADSGNSGNSAKTDENAPGPSNEDNITPKSTVKPIPEAVKLRYSTAKKPKSRRSIIDSLDDSIIVKNLFNTPVKRKLSQSMTEYNRDELSDDETVPTKTQLRRTVGATGRTPNQTFVVNVQTPQVSTDLFVSPLDNSKVTRNSPRNSRQPGKKSRNSVTAAMSTRLSGVKNLFKAKRSPRNDLRDVRGVRNIFLKGNSPRNDLRDVRGVKRMFARDNPRNDLEDISGVEELFNANDSKNTSGAEELFDQLVGRPNIKATYSKSFTRPHQKKTTKPPTSNSLRVHDDLVNNVEEWLQEQLNIRAHNKSKIKKTTPKSALLKSKELQKLATDTVAGSTPIRVSRIRVNTVNNKSASRSRLTIDRNSLPFKKRSLTNVTSAEKQLPIKKRAIVHSTPLKGKRGTIVVVTEMGRVSPIVPAHDVEQSIILEKSSKSINESKRAKSKTANTPVQAATPKPRRATRGKAAETNVKRRRSSLVITKKKPQMSPEKPKTVGKQDTPKTSPPKRRTRGAKFDTAPVVVEKRVPTKSAMKIEPKPAKIKRGANAAPENVSKTISPKKTRGARASKAVQKSPEKPKRATRGRKTTEVAAKSPVPKKKVRIVSPALTTPPKNAAKKTKAPPKGNKRAASPEKTETQAKRGRGKQAETPVTPSPKQVRTTRTKQVKLSSKGKAENNKVASPIIVVIKPSPKANPQPAKRTRANIPKELPDAKPKGRKAKLATPVKSPKPRRGRATLNESIKKPIVKNARGSKANAQILETKEEVSLAESPKKAKVTGRGRGQGKRVVDKVEVVPEKKPPQGRKRKADAVPDSSPPVKVVAKRPARGKAPQKGNTPSPKKTRAVANKKNVPVKEKPVRGSRRNK